MTWVSDAAMVRPVLVIGSRLSTVQVSVTVTLPPRQVPVGPGCHDMATAGCVVHGDCRFDA